MDIYTTNLIFEDLKKRLQRYIYKISNFKKTVFIPLIFVKSLRKLLRNKSIDFELFLCMGIAFLERLAIRCGLSNYSVTIDNNLHEAIIKKIFKKEIILSFLCILNKSFFIALNY